MTLKLKSTGRIYKVTTGEGYPTGTPEENAARKANGNSYFRTPNTLLYYCRVLKNGVPFGATRIFTSEQVELV